MLLRNYDNIMLARMGAYDKAHSDVSKFGNGYVNIKITNGEIFPLMGVSNYWLYNPLNLFKEDENDRANTGGASNIICGSGSTPAHYDDYKLESPFSLTQIRTVSSVQKYETPIYDEETDTWTFTYTRNYLANEDITVREIGVLSSPYYSTGNNSLYKATLVYRKVLETPLEVTAGNQFTLTFTATLSANPNKPADYDVNTVAVE